MERVGHDDDIGLLARQLDNFVGVALDEPAIGHANGIQPRTGALEHLAIKVARRSIDPRQESRYSPQALIATLARLLREDAGFDAYQLLEAGVRQFAVWGDTDEGRHIIIAVARYLAAHSPTERAALQTADIARRLMRGGELHQSAGAP